MCANNKNSFGKLLLVFSIITIKAALVTPYLWIVSVAFALIGGYLILASKEHAKEENATENIERKEADNQ